MPLQMIGIPKENGIKQYQVLTTDNINIYPTVADCAAGSTMIVIDAAIKRVVSFLYFDGTNWDTL